MYGKKATGGGPRPASIPSVLARPLSRRPSPTLTNQKLCSRRTAPGLYCGLSLSLSKPFLPLAARSALELIKEDWNYRRGWQLATRYWNASTTHNASLIFISKQNTLRNKLLRKIETTLYYHTLSLKTHTRNCIYHEENILHTCLENTLSSLLFLIKKLIRKWAK